MQLAEGQVLNCLGLLKIMRQVQKLTNSQCQARVPLQFLQVGTQSSLEVKIQAVSMMMKAGEWRKPQLLCRARSLLQAGGRDHQQELG